MTKFKVVFIVMMVIVVALITFRASFIVNNIQKGEHVYYIEVNTFNQIETYVTTSYKLDSATRCLTFKDEFGFSKTVCNNYTITNYK